MRDDCPQLQIKAERDLARMEQQERRDRYRAQREERAREFRARQEERDQRSLEQGIRTGRVGVGNDGKTIWL